MDNIIEEFNKTLEEFVIKLINQFPTEKKNKSYLTSLRITKMYDKKLPIKIYMGGCLNFKEQIKTRDSDFFINRPQFVERVNNCTSFADDIGLVEHWVNLNELSKNSIWEYIQTLFVMGEMYINNDVKVLNNINDIYNNLSKDEIEHMNKESKISDKLISKIKNE